MSQVQLIITGDGSHSLFRSDLDETYHSRHGATQESQHVFIKNGLHYWLGKSGNKQPVIFEVGFGTGLNAWLTLQEARKEGLHVTYISIETFPLQRDVWAQLNYTEDSSFALMHEATWNAPVVIDDCFTLNKVQGKLEDYAVADPINIVYFDAFAPSKQPELWTLPVLENVCRTLTEPGVFVTYCAKGQLKRDLRSLGLQVETLPGPPGKKEMVRASSL